MSRVKRVGITESDRVLVLGDVLNSMDAITARFATDLPRAPRAS